MFLPHKSAIYMPTAFGFQGTCFKSQKIEYHVLQM